MMEKSEGSVKQSLYAEFMAGLNSDEGLAGAWFEEKRHVRVAPGITLESFVTDLIDHLAVTLKDGRIVWNMEFEVARKAFNLAKAEAKRGSVVARKELKLPVVHDSHL